ncbi:MAG: hypothetical protein VXW65_02865, partial [Pseudomonadota bacterium]|nr:hypothetical protein [Pseudomonadota bacterium]
SPEDICSLNQLIVDQRHWMNMQVGQQQLNAKLIQHAIPRAPQAAEHFKACWQRAQPLLELRRLSL